MASRKIPLSEAIEKNIPVGFDFTDEMFERSKPSLEKSMREHGWKGHSEEVSKKKTGGSGNNNVEIGDGDSE